MDLDIPLNRSARALLPYQIGRGIIDLITSGAVTPGSRLPSTRELAKHLRVARMTVVDAYRWLTDQGYVESRQGSGTVVRKMRIVVPEQRRPARAMAKASTAPASAKPQARGEEIDFRAGLPDLASFPRRHWIAALARSGRTLPDSSLGYGDPLGQERLRRAIANYLHRSRGLTVPPQNVVVTVGAAQALDILLRTWPERREMVVEAPLAQLDRAGRVIYSGTFSKTLAPALRIGFMVVPDHVLERIRLIKWWADSGGWVIQQDALAHWMESGLFERHVQRMRKVYHQSHRSHGSHSQLRAGDRRASACPQRDRASDHR